MKLIKKCWNLIDRYLMLVWFLCTILAGLVGVFYGPELGLSKSNGVDAPECVDTLGRC